MKIDKTSVGDLTATLSIHIEKADYIEQFKKELRKYADKAQLKGFRKGKTPIGVVKKMYGQGVLAEVINTTLQESLSGYITEQKLELLGQPLPAEDQEGDIDFNVNDLQDYTFKYDIGLAPEFELAGLTDKDKYDIHDIELSDAIVDEEIGFITKKFGTQEDVEGAIEVKDIISINADELQDGKPKKDGWATEFTVMVDTLADNYKEAILKLSTGDSFNFDPYSLEDGKDKEYVHKYILNVKTEEGEEEPTIGNEFVGNIVGIKRLVPAEFNQELFDKYFPKGEVKSEEDARKKIADNIQKHYDNQATQIMYREIMDKLIDDTQVDLPADFLKRWVTETNQDASAEDIEKDFDGFLKNLKWTLIKSKLSTMFDVTVESEEVYAAMEQKVRGYFGQYGMDESYVAQIMQNMMQNREEVNKTYEELQAEKIFSKIGDTVGKKKKKISVEDFNELVKELNSKQAAA